jgi:hypothetical protein
LNAATAEYFEAKFFMANKLVLFSAGAVVIAAAVYAGGVYYTGVKVNEYLSGIENNETISKQLSYYLPGSNLSCKVDKDSFFTEQGSFILSVEDESVKIPFTINKGFGSAKTIIGTDEFVSLVEKNDAIKFAPNTVKADLEFDSSVFSSKIKGHGRLQADYQDNSKGKLDSVLDVDLTSDENVISHLNIRNLQDGKSFSVKEIDMSGNMQGITDLKSIGNSSVVIKGFEAMPYKFDNLKLTSQAVNQTKEGDFDMNITLSGDDLFGYLQNYDIDFTLSKFNTDVLEKASQNAAVDDGSYQDVLKSLNSLTVNKLNGRVGKIVAFFTGIQNVDQFNLTSGGKFTWNLEEGMDSLKGNLTVKSDSNKNAEQFFVEKNGAFESELAIENGRLTVNGKPFL